jgi:hypothetical protein
VLVAAARANALPGWIAWLGMVLAFGKPNGTAAEGDRFVLAQ